MLTEIEVQKKSDELIEEINKLMYSDGRYDATQIAILHVEKIIELTTHDLGHDQTARGICEEYEQILNCLKKKIK